MTRSRSALATALLWGTAWGLAEATLGHLLLEAPAGAVWVKLAGTEALLALSPCGDKRKRPDLLTAGRP